MNILYGIFVTVMGLITSMLFVRVFRLIMAELFEESPLGNKYISPLVILAISGFLAFVGSWTNLWIFFGGTNQLLAGLALLLVAIFLASIKKPTAYVFVPGIFMTVLVGTTASRSSDWSHFSQASSLLYTGTFTL